MASTGKGYAWWIRGIELLSLGAFGALTVISLTPIAARAERVEAAGWVIAAAVFAALLFADFVSGFVHWAADNWGNARWPLVGPLLIKPFREHHRVPKEITEHDFVGTNGNNCLISLPTFGAAFAFSLPPTWSLFQAVFWVALAWWVLLTNQIHAWAHTDEPPRLVRWLQRWRLILSPEHHEVHHTPPHDRHYCITTGWLNPVLGKLRFFPILEWCMTALTGMRPRHLDHPAAPTTDLYRAGTDGPAGAFRRG